MRRAQLYNILMLSKYLYTRTRYECIYGFHYYRIFTCMHIEYERIMGLMVSLHLSEYI
jgi:hypothetical protein